MIAADGFCHVILDREQVVVLAGILEMQLRELGEACARASIACDGAAVRMIHALMEQAQMILDEVHLAVARGAIEAQAQAQLAEYRATKIDPNTRKGN